jgi:hypothetical protein
LRLFTAVIAAAIAALAIVPAVARATVTSSQITSWITYGQGGGVSNASYLISDDTPTAGNFPTGLAVSGTAPGAGASDRVDIVCFYGQGAGAGHSVLVSNVAVTRSGQTAAFATSTGSAAPALRAIAGHACRLRAIPAGGESSDDIPAFAGPQIAVSEAGLPSATISGHPYDFFVDGTTFTGYAAWGSAGSCGPYSAPLDPSFGMGNFAINCMGSLLAGDLPGGGSRSEVQVDGHNAYDAASAEAAFGGTESLTNFPSLTASVNWDPATGLASSQSTESWVVCPGLSSYPPTLEACPSFAPSGVQLQRDVGMSDGGQVVTMTDTWSSTDGNAHTLDLLYDDYVGLKASTAQRGYQFPGQSGFTPYGAGATVPGPSAAPGSILVRTNLAAPDGDPSEAAGAITFSSAPAGFAFVSNNEFEEHQILRVPAGGSVRQTYIYSTGYSVADAEALAHAAQDRIESPAIAITSPAGGATVSTPTVTVSGLAASGSGISSLVVGGQPVSVGPGAAWSAQVPLRPGANTITAIATDDAGATAQAHVAVVYQPSPTPAAARCKVPRTKGMKLPAAEKAIRRAHCRVGKIKKKRSRKIRRGRVVGSSPPAGRKLAVGAKIELFVSKGR